MTAEDFIEQVSRVRVRFACALPGKIADSFADLEKMSASGAEAIDTVITAHRRLHEMYGIAPTLGFQATGQAAGEARTAICQAAEAKRAATPAEIAVLKTELERLRTAAEGELKIFANQKGVTAQ